MEATPTIVFGGRGRIEFVEAQPIPREGHRLERHLRRQAAEGTRTDAERYRR